MVSPLSAIGTSYTAIASLFAPLPLAGAPLIAGLNLPALSQAEGADSGSSQASTAAMQAMQGLTLGGSTSPTAGTEASQSAAPGAALVQQTGSMNLLTDSNFKGTPAPGSPYDQAGAYAALRYLEGASSALTKMSEMLAASRAWANPPQPATNVTVMVRQAGTVSNASPGSLGLKMYAAVRALAGDGNPYIRQAAQSLLSRVTGVDNDGWRLQAPFQSGGVPLTQTQGAEQFLANEPDAEITKLALGMATGNLAPDEPALVAARLSAVANNSVIFVPYSSLPQFDEQDGSVCTRTTVLPSNAIVAGGGSDWPSLAAIFPPAE